MNTVPKLILTIQLQGRIGRISEKKEVIPVRYDTDLNGKKLKEPVQKVAIISPRITQSCVQKINISEEAYLNFISDNVPSWEKANVWAIKKKKDRVYSHCRRIADGKEFSVEFLK